MIDKSIEELFTTIENSKEYQEYIKIKDILLKNEEVITLTNKIKKLQQESVNLEYNNDSKYKIIDQEIETNVNILNNIKEYQEYLTKMNKLNNVLNKSSKLIETYINEKI